MLAGLRSALAAAGLDVAAEIAKGSLVLSSETHLHDGLFDVDLMLKVLTDGVCQALKDGYRGLWASGDMLWEFGNEKNFGKLLEYELGLEHLLRQHPTLSGICQYHRDTVPVEAVQVGLYTHQTVFINETLSRFNPFYAEPRTLRYGSAEQAAASVDGMLRRLAPLD